MFSIIDLILSQPGMVDELGQVGILDIGAMALEGTQKEYRILQERKVARIVGFEPVAKECERLNQRFADSNVSFLPYFIGNGKRQKFYLNNYSMTSSLYEPNTELLRMFQNLEEFTQTVAVQIVETKKLDEIGELDFSVDYIKMDIQGAELQALEGAKNRILNDVLVIHTEVEWVPLYKGQPLFSELELFLRQQGFMLHQITGFGSRCFKPVANKVNPFQGFQQLWSDVIFVRDFTRLSTLSSEQLLKMAVILHEIYHSIDLVLVILQEYDRKKGSSFARIYQSKIGLNTETADNSVPEKGLSGSEKFISLYSAGVKAFNENDFDSALELFMKARLFNPDFPQLFYNLGLTFARLGRVEEALKSLDKALEINPGYDEVKGLRSSILGQMQSVAENNTSGAKSEDFSEMIIEAINCQNAGNNSQAEEIFMKVLGLDSQNFSALFSMGNIEHFRGNMQKALEYYDKAMKVRPDFPQLWYNRGVVFQSMNRLEEALEHYDQALALDPGYHDVRLNRGWVLAEMKRHKDALLNYEELIRVDPGNVKALCNRGIILTDFNLHDAAIQTFQRLVALSPDYEFALGLLAFAKMHACDWNKLQNLREKIIQGVREGRPVCKSMAFTAISDDPCEQINCARIFAKRFYNTLKPVWQGEIYDHKKIRVAYISPDFREHPVGYLLAGILEQHDSNRFQIAGLSLGLDDGSELRRRIKSAMHEFIDVRNISSYEIANMIKEKEIDILVDLGGYTADTRTDVLAFRPAPVQVNFLGYSSSMGADFIDYIIADRYVIPEDKQHCFSENVVYMPDSYLPADATVKIAARKERAEYGLPEEAFVFCSFNHDYKISPEIFKIWMRLLDKVPDSVLWLMKLNEIAEENLRKEAIAAGIDPARIIFATRVPSIEDHLARYKLADLFLDTFPCNAHSTSSDVLRVGLPMVTCRGSAFASRVAAGLLTVSGFPELITDNLDDYEKVAFDLATNPKKLKKLRSRLEMKAVESPLFDSALYCRNLETAFTRMCEISRKGKKPETFAV